MTKELEKKLYDYWIDSGESGKELQKYIDAIPPVAYFNIPPVKAYSWDKAKYLIDKWRSERIVQQNFTPESLNRLNAITGKQVILNEDDAKSENLAKPIGAPDLSDEVLAEMISEVNKVNNCDSGNCFTGNFEWKDETKKDVIFVESPEGKFDVIEVPWQEKSLSENGQLKHKGLRFNKGKLRYDLVQPWAHEQMVAVLTKGAEKYAERNWEKGMAWSNVLASLERHLQAVKKGEDYDPETGLLHAAHIACNAHFLTAYYKIYPQGDDRPHSYLSRPKIGLDIDDVIADFVGKWEERHEISTPEFWNFDKDIAEKFEQVKTDKEFWMSIKPKISPKDLPFEPACYITARPIPTEWTEEWLQQNGFPAVSVYTVGYDQSKIEVAKKAGIDIFVDDRYDNFVELNNAGIATFLMDAAHNRRYDVGARRIYNLKDLL